MMSIQNLVNLDVNSHKIEIDKFWKTIETLLKSPELHNSATFLYKLLSTITLIEESNLKRWN